MQQRFCMAGTMKMFCIRKTFFSHRKNHLLFLPCNMAAKQNLYNPHGLFLPKFPNALIISETTHHFVQKLFLVWQAWSASPTIGITNYLLRRWGIWKFSGNGTCNMRFCYRCLRFFPQCFPLVHHMANLHENEKTIWRLFVSINLKRAQKIDFHSSHVAWEEQLDSFSYGKK